MPIPKTQIPNFYCSDRAVQAFCEREMHDFNPYNFNPKTARQLIEAAIARYGHWRCYDIEFWQH
jgi:hypothetical protein